MKKDIFRIDGGQGFGGYHNPERRWNGYCQPYFNYETIKQIATMLEKGKNPDSPQFIFGAGGRVFEIYCGEWSELSTTVIDGVTHYTTDGWIWDCDSDLEEVTQ